MKGHLIAFIVLGILAFATSAEEQIAPGLYIAANTQVLPIQSLNFSFSEV